MRNLYQNRGTCVQAVTGGFHYWLKTLFKGLAKE